MSDDLRREVEWPSEDLTQARRDQERRDAVEWPSEDRADDHHAGDAHADADAAPTWGPTIDQPVSPSSPASLGSAPPPSTSAPPPSTSASPPPERPTEPPPERPTDQPPFPLDIPPTLPSRPLDIPPTPPPVVPEPPVVVTSAPDSPWPDPVAPEPTPFPLDIPPTPRGPSAPPPVYPRPAQYPPQPPAPPASGPYGSPQPPIAFRPGPFALLGAPDSSSPGPTIADVKRPHFRPDIEGLRAVAVIAVLLFHIGLPFATGGYVGVDVFYVISGFLITSLLLREGLEYGKVDLLRFYARRMRRLLPAALLVIVVTLAASIVIVTPLRLTEIAGDAAAAALYVANFRFAFEAADYLALEAPSPLLHYWSLGVEEQFYLVWPLILLAATRFLPLRLVGHFFLALALVSFGLSLYLTEASQAWAFFSPVTRAWELAAGALVAVGLLRIPRRLPRMTAPIVVLAGLALIVTGVVVLGTESAFPGVAALLPVTGATLVVMGGLRGPTLPGRVLLSNPVARYLGRISYSLYLWHWPLLILVPIAMENDELVFRVALAGVAVVLAAISTELVEQPFRRSGGLAGRSRGSIQLGLAASVAVGVAALVMSGAITLPANLLPRDPLVLELAGVREDLPRSYADGCHLPYEVTKPRDDCVYGDPEGEQTIFLIGDSHAAQWVPALDAYAAERGRRLEVHTKSACSVADVPLWERKLLRQYDECFEWRESLLKRIKRTEPEMVLVGSSRDYELWSNGSIVRTNDAYTYWQQKLTELLQALDENAARVVLLAEMPFLNFDPVDCLADRRRSSCDPPSSLVLDLDYAALESAAAAAAGAEVLSLNAVLCHDGSCPVVVDDIVVFRDRHHVTAGFMAHLAEPVANLIEGRAPFPTPPQVAPLVAGAALGVPAPVGVASPSPAAAS